MSTNEIKVIKMSDVKIQNIKISAPRANKKGGKAIYINYDYEDGRGPKPLRVQMPKMKVPFGISGYEPDRKEDGTPTEKSNDSLEFSLGEREDIIKKLEAIDKLILETAGDKSIEYFNKKMKPDVIEAFFTSSLKYNKDKEGKILNTYPPRIKTKLYKDDNGKYTIDVFNSSKQPVKLDIYNHDTVLPRGSECVSLLECGGIWIVSGKFGVSWRPKQMIVYKADHSLSGFSFIPDEEITTEEQVEEADEVTEDADEEAEEETEEVEETEEQADEEETDEADEPEEDPLDQVTEELEEPKEPEEEEEVIEEPKPKVKAKTVATPKKKKV